MKRAILVALGTGAAISSAVAAFELGTFRTQVEGPMSNWQYQVALAVIHAEREEALEGCVKVRAAEREVCRAQADAAEMARTAELEAVYRRSPQAARASLRAQIEARYTVARARCASLGGTRRDDCFVNAHAARGRALLETHAPYDSRAPSIS